MMYAPTARAQACCRVSVIGTPGADGNVRLLRRRLGGPVLRVGLHLVRVTTPDQDFMIELPFDRVLPKRKYPVVDLTTDN